jgi:hypothetical protein
VGAIRGRRNIDAQGIGDGFAHVQRFQQRQLFAICQHEVGKFQQHLLAGFRRLLRPDTPVERRPAARHRPFDVELLARRDHPQRTASGRVDVVESGAVGGGGETPVDERLGARFERGGAFAPLCGGNDGRCGHRKTCQNVGGVEAEMISQTSSPTLRKRWGVELEK